MNLGEIGSTHDRENASQLSKIEPTDKFKSRYKYFGEIEVGKKEPDRITISGSGQHVLWYQPYQ